MTNAAANTQACLDETTGARLLAGELSPHDAELAHRHIATCRDCQHFVAELARACVDSDTKTSEATQLSEATQPEVNAELRRGATVGRFLVLGRIGSGGMGVVHAAYDPELDRRVAIKLLRSAGRDARDNADVRARLLREAQAAARLSHPNVVAVFDIGTFEDRVYLAMEYIDGVTLAEWLRGDRSFDQIVDLFLQAGRGIAAAHDAGVIHRDFKPDNVLVGRDGRARVVDFGLARAADADPSLSGSASPSPAARTDDPDETQPAIRSGIATPLTRTGALLGTPRFMAPEQFTGGEITPSTDQFGFCVALYSALYRTQPFRGERVNEIASHVLAGEIDAPVENRGPAALRRAIVRGLAVDPARRHASMAALLRELERARSVRRRWRYIAISAAAAAVVAGATFALTGGARDDAARPCIDSSSKVRAVWNDDRQAKLRAAFDTHHLPYGEQAARSVTARLDAYANGWAAMRTEACAATHVDHEQSPQLLDLRIACLDDRLAELTAFVAALETADTDTVRRAVDGADRLAPLATCADRVALAAPIRPPDAAIASRVDAVSDQLAPVAALERLGKIQPALAAAERACAGVDALAYAPLVARCRHVVGTLVYDAAGANARAADLLTEAVTQAIAGNDPRRVADAAVALARVVGDGLARYEEAERWATLADGAGTRLADRGELDVRLAAVRGLIATRRGQHADALAQFKKRLALVERRHPEGGLPVANANVYVGHALVALGRYADAEPHYRRALLVTEEVSGTTHPNLLPVLDGLGQLQWALGHPDAAVPYLERSLAITRNTVAKGHPSLVTAIANLGGTLANAGELDRSLKYLEEARATVATTDRRQLALILTNLVLVHQLRGEHARALAMAEEALVVEREVKGEDHAETALAHFNVGDALMSNARPRDAIASIRKALAIWETTMPADHPYFAVGRSALGDALVRTGDPRAAIPLLERAIAGYEAQGAVPELARTRFVLAQALWASNVDRKRGVALATTAADAVRPDRAKHAALLAEIEKWIAGRR